MRILGAILAGGRSSRFGSDKAQAMLGDRSLLAHSARALGAQVDGLVICGRDEPGLVGLIDRPAPELGPLGGINAALHHALDEGYDGVLTTGCDMPVYPAALAQALVGVGPSVLAGQQLTGYWPATLAPGLDAYLAQDNNRSIRGWIAGVDARVVYRPDIVLPNINRPEDLAALRDGGISG